MNKVRNTRGSSKIDAISQHAFSQYYEETHEGLSDNITAVNSIRLKEYGITGNLVNTSSRIPLKIISATFEVGNMYDLDIIPTNVTNNVSSDIEVVIRTNTDQSVAIVYGIKERTHYTYFCKNTHDGLYVSVYNGSCDVQVSAREIFPIVGIYAIEGTEFKADYESGELKLYYWNESNGLDHIAFGTNDSNIGKYECFFSKGICYATVLTSSHKSVGIVKTAAQSIYANGKKIEISIKDLPELVDIKLSKSNPTPFVPNNYVLDNKITDNLNEQSNTGITPDGGYVKSGLGAIHRIAVEVGNKYFVSGYYVTKESAMAAIGQFDSIAFSNPKNLIVQEANTKVVYCSVIEAVSSYLYVPDTIDVYLLKGQQTDVDEVLDPLSKNPVTNAAITNAINSINKQICETEGKPAVLTIAASNSPDYAKKNANLICSGVNDEQIINTAINILSEDGGEIHLSAGLFLVSNPIIIDRRVKIVGEGHSIGGIPPYTPTSSVDYNSNIYDIKVQNLYGSNGGGTIIRANADCHIIQIGRDKSQKLQIVLRDFSIQGYGKDRHTKCGIYGKSSTDISVIDNVSVTDCYIGCYLHGNSSNSWNDAIKIINSSFQWCAMGLVAYAYWGILLGCCVADNNGIESYTDDDGNTTSLNCGSIYLGGNSWIATNNIIVRSVSYTLSESIGGDAVVISAPRTMFSNNMVSQCAGALVRLDADYIRVEGNLLRSWGKSGIEGDMAAIKQSQKWVNMCEIKNNTFRDAPSTLGATDFIINLTSGGIHVIKENSFVSIGKSFTRYIKTPDAIADGNIAYGYDNDQKYKENIL